jgi:signal transduction histidine kinase
MTFHLKARALPVAVIVSTVVVILLAVLQYRWSREVSEATGVRLADTLQLSMINWHHDFLRNFSEICLTMRVDPEREPFTDLSQDVRRLAEWQAVARYPELVAAVYLLTPDGPGSFEARRLDPTTRRLEPVSWRDRFGYWSEDFHRVRPDPADATTPVTFAGDAVRGWHFEPDPPALLHRTGSGWIVIELDAGIIRSKILPDLAHRYFQGTDGLDYQVAVVAGSTPRQVLYGSDPGFGDVEVVDADGTLNVFGRRLSAAFPSPLRVFHRTSQSRAPSTVDTVSWFPRLHQAPPENDWHLIVRHRRGGPLGAFVSDMQRRDLAISFGALLLLVVSMGMLIAASNRAQRLARLQLDFVTAVSHELRTPLTVINSAADNLAQGVVRGQEQLAQYGTVIGNQVRQLSALIEEVLLFAATNNGQHRLSLRPLQVSEIIDATLSSTDGLIRAAQFTVERDIPRGLPPVMGDLVALSQVLQNLITNALKYSREQRWLGIRARMVDRGLTGREIQISVSDRGIGINDTDLPHIFEPFYRSPSVTEAQIHGTGLGLTLARRMAEAMKGQLTVTSQPGGGSTFILHLSCADQTQGEAGLELPHVRHDPGIPDEPAVVRK